MSAVLKQPTKTDRTKFLGGSDVASILGISPWRTAYQTWLDKCEPCHIDDETLAKKRLYQRGKRLEPYVADMLQEEAGVVLVARNQRYIDPEHGFIACEIDAEAQTGENVELKTVNAFAAKEWGEQQTDEIPVHYTAQVMHGLMVTNRPACIVGALIGADDFRVYRVERDDETIAAMREKEVRFWLDHVLTKIPPKPTTVDDLALLYGGGAGTVLDADDDLVEIVNQLRTAKASAKDAEARLAHIESSVKLIMREHSTILVDGKPAVTWKGQSVTRLDQQAFKAAHPALFEQFLATSQMRVFRVK